MKTIAVLLLITVTGFSSYGQVFSNKEVGKKNAVLADSLKKSEYPYSLPIWGQKATAKGYNLPYSAGLSTQYFWAQTDIIIENLSVGFNNGPMYDLSEIVRFDVAKATAASVTVRPDIWLLPFLSVYGILGKSGASTEVNFGVWLPDETGVASEVLEASTLVEFNTSTYGFGFTPTIGVGGGFLALDMNWAWTDVPQLSQPARSFVFAPRFGKNFKLKKPESAIAIWTGAFRFDMRGQTDGSLPLAEVFPPDGPINQRVDQAIVSVADKQQQVETWWTGLTPAEQANPINKAKYDRATSALDKAGQVLEAADAALADIGNSTVQYSMQKRVKDRWNFIVGSQYQLNKHFMIRVEYGFLGSRTHAIVGLQYRFGL